MSTITVVNTQGDSTNVELTPGLSLMELLRDEGFDEIMAMCGGCCSCATCHVHISLEQAGTLPPVEEDEEMLLENTDSYDAEKSRLSCQIELTEQHAGMTVTIVEQD